MKRMLLICALLLCTCLTAHAACVISFFPTQGAGKITPRYFNCALSSEKPASGLHAGDLAYAQDNTISYVATNSTTWAAISGGSGATSCAALTDSGTGCTGDAQVLANPTGTIGLTAVNGSNTTAMRSDSAPALSQAIAPTWTGRHILANLPVYDQATGVLATGILQPLDTASHTVAANKVYMGYRFSQASGADNTFNIGSGGVVAGYASYVGMEAGSDATAALYPVVGSGTNAGAGSVKGMHAAALATGTSTGVLVGIAAQVEPVSTSNVSSAAVQAQITGNVNDVATGINISSDGARFIYGIGSPTAAVPYNTAFLSGWMATASGANARFLQLRNNAGTEIFYVSKAGDIQGPSATITTGTIPTLTVATTLAVLGVASFSGGSQVTGSSHLSLDQPLSTLSRLTANGPDTSTNGILRIDTVRSDISNGVAVATFGPAGVQIGTPTGGDKGVGTLNAQGAYYANGTIGVSSTATVCSAGACTSTCTMIFVGGIRTGGTC